MDIDWKKGRWVVENGERGQTTNPLTKFKCLMSLLLTAIENVF